MIKASTNSPQAALGNDTSRLPLALTDRPRRTGERPRPIASVTDLGQRRDEPAFRRFSELYHIERVAASPLRLANEAWREAFKCLGATREFVEEQELVIIRDCYLGTEAVYNDLLPRPSVVAAASEPLAPGDVASCVWCGRRGRYYRPELWREVVGNLTAGNGPVRAFPDLIRQSAVSGVVLGGSSMHDPMALTADDFESLGAAAEEYIRSALRYVPAPFFAFEFSAGRASGTSPHALIRVLGRTDRHFPYAEKIVAATPADYWQASRDVHESLGLTIRESGCEAWLSLTPPGEWEVFAQSPSLRAGCRFCHALIHTLLRHRPEGVALAAFLAPSYVAEPTPEDRFSGWPPVLWRLIGPAKSRPSSGDSDGTGLLESPVAADPFMVVQWLKGTVAW
jgi:hypothetical protein